MIKRSVLLFVFCALIFMSACAETPPEIVDYVDLIEHSDEYEGKTVRTYGCISYIESGMCFEFNERLGHNQETFYVTLKNNTGTVQYSKQDYIVVEGIFSSKYEGSSRDYYTPGNRFSLKNAVVVSSGDEAQALSDTAWTQWREERDALAQGLPLTDYMSILDNPEPFVDTYVRISGRISYMHPSPASLTFSTRDHRGFVNSDDFYADIDGIPLDVLEQCAQGEGEPVVLSGKVIILRDEPRLVDCWVESIGQQAEQSELETENTYRSSYAKARADFISSCTPYAYEELARFPDNYKGERVEVSGTIYQIDNTNYLVTSDSIIESQGIPHILVDVGGALVYVAYSGISSDDALLLVGDSVIFYGSFFGQKTYITVLGSNNTVPYISAQYSSINLVD